MQGVLVLGERLQAWDVAAFRLINQGAAHPALDPLMALLSLTGLGSVQLLLLALAYVLGGPAVKRTALFAVVVFALSGLGVQAAKELFPRDRPSLAVEEVRFLEHLAHSRSFPSGHAATAFALAVFAAIRHRRWAVPLLLWAAGVGTARIYVGQHFPGDVLGAALLGTASALIVARLEVRTRRGRTPGEAPSSADPACRAAAPRGTP
ncbi:MAG: phosphatase PAP2 family protein [Armatimonadota bacterium]|nr:phosphatase PAP2 family protein [Armatimonadota bacterium]